MEIGHRGCTEHGAAADVAREGAARNQAVCYPPGKGMIMFFITYSRGLQIPFSFWRCCDAHSASEMGHKRPANDVRGEGSVPRKQPCEATRTNAGATRLSWPPVGFSGARRALPPALRGETLGRPR
jgi:hypothetical protein